MHPYRFVVAPNGNPLTSFTKPVKCFAGANTGKDIENKLP